MSQLVLQHFVALKPGQLLVCNRDGTKAQALAEQFNGRAVPFELLDEHLVAADIVAKGGTAFATKISKSFAPRSPRRWPLRRPDMWKNTKPIAPNH